MKAYLVGSFRRNRGGAIFRRQETGRQASGSYVNQTPNHTDQPMHLYQFICNGNYSIHSIIRQTEQRGGRQGADPIQVEFTVGQEVTANNNARIRIERFLIVDGDTVHVISEDGTAYPLTRIETRRVQAEVAAAQPVAQADRDAFITTLENRVIAAHTRPFRLERTLRRRTENLHQFLINFFTDFNKNRNTIYIDDRSVQTDTNRGEGRRRSLGDIYMICKYYYPNATMREILHELYVALPAHFTSGFRTSKCNTIHKRVWYYDRTSGSGVFDQNDNDEYGHRYATVQSHLQ